MSTHDHVAIVGAGAWGTTLALVASRAGSRVTLVAHRAEVAAYLHNVRQHPTSLPGVNIPPSIGISCDDDGIPADATTVVLAIPVQSLRAALPGWRSRIPSVPVLNVAKGIEVRTLMRPTEVIADLLEPASGLATLSGPNLATEIAAGKPAVSVVASASADVAERFVTIFHGPSFRVYRGSDVVGVELGGALKNVIAIAAGMAKGLGAGDNATASLITRGLAEITRLGVASGAEAATFAGISGLGDLIATCASPLSRNHRVGLGLAQGQSLERILADLGETAEGVPTTEAANQMAARLGIEAPITRQLHRVLFEATPVEEAIEALLMRLPTTE